MSSRLGKLKPVALPKYKERESVRKRVGEKEREWERKKESGRERKRVREREIEKRKEKKRERGKRKERDKRVRGRYKKLRKIEIFYANI